VGKWYYRTKCLYLASELYTKYCRDTRNCGVINYKCCMYVFVYMRVLFYGQQPSQDHFHKLLLERKAICSRAAEVIALHDSSK